MSADNGKDVKQRFSQHNCCALEFLFSQIIQTALANVVNKLFYYHIFSMLLNTERESILGKQYVEKFQKR